MTGTKNAGTKNKRPLAHRSSASLRRTATEMILHPPTSDEPTQEDSEEKAKTTKVKPSKAASIVACKTSGASSKGRLAGRRAGAAKLLSSGPPDEEIKGGWTGNWIKKVYQRQSGATKGSKDRYWFTPTLQLKLRSLREVQRFQEAMVSCNGNEKAAYKAAMKKKLTMGKEKGTEKSTAKN